MKILVTGFTSNYGGVENFIMNYYRVMKKLDTQFILDIISMSENPAYKAELIESGSRVWKIARGRNKFRQRQELKKIMRENQYDILWCNKCDLADITILKVGTTCGIPVRIIHSHNSENMYEGLRGKLIDVLHRYNRNQLAKYVTGYWACSDYAAEWLFVPEIVEEKKYRFVPNAIDCEKFRFDNIIRNEYRRILNIEEKFVVGCVGRFSYQKNPEFTLEIFREIVKMNSNAMLIWVGVGELQESIEEKIRRYRLEDKVQLLGVRNDVEKLMQAMDCLILPSRFEGLPVVAVEAQAAGLPVFAAEEGISQQTKITEKCHFLSLKMEPEKWATTIAEINRAFYEKDKKIDVDEKFINRGFEIESASANILNYFKQLLHAE